MLITRCTKEDAVIFIFQALCSGDLSVIARAYDCDDYDGYLYQGLCRIKPTFWYGYTPQLFKETAAKFEPFYEFPFAAKRLDRGSFIEAPMIEGGALDQMIEAGDTNHSRGGRPLKFEWEEIWFRVVRHIHYYGIPETAGALIRIIHQICLSRH